MNSGLSPSVDAVVARKYNRRESRGRASAPSTKNLEKLGPFLLSSLSEGDSSLKNLPRLANVTSMCRGETENVVKQQNIWSYG